MSLLRLDEGISFLQDIEGPDPRQPLGSYLWPHVHVTFSVVVPQCLIHVCPLCVFSINLVLSAWDQILAEEVSQCSHTTVFYSLACDVVGMRFKQE